MLSRLRASLYITERELRLAEPFEVMSYGLMALVQDPDGKAVGLGTTARTVTPGLRRALMVRDGHCRAEGCSVPASWCEAHHAGDPWSRGGRTDLREGRLLCRHHHRLSRS